ncbi:MAG: cytochrome C [Thiohalocapsa sp.]
MRQSIRTWGIAFAALFALGAAGLAIGDSDEHDDDDHRRGGWIEPRADVRPVTNDAYAEECGACHMAYQPGLLPGAAWLQIMRADALAAHYGDDASLSDTVRAEITDYLLDNGADRASRSRSRAFAVGDGGAGTLPRITATRYFRNEHHEIPARMVANNSGVGSFSNCNTCHQGAAEGVFNEHRVKIPGFGRWDD